MKQYTTNKQTAKLVEMGFDKPKSIRYPLNEEEVDRVNSTDFLISDYTIGELIEVLPKDMDCETWKWGLNIENNIYETPNEWIVSYDIRHITNSIELVDALFDMIVMLKDEGVI